MADLSTQKGTERVAANLSTLAALESLRSPLGNHGIHS